MVTAASEMELFLPKSYDIFWSLVILIIVAVFFYKFFLPKFQAVFDERAAKIEGGIAKAEQAQKDADEAKAKYDAQLSNARVEASKIRDDARAEASHIIADARTRAEADAAQITATAQRSIESQQQQALVSLKGEVGVLATTLQNTLEQLRHNVEVANYMADRDTLTGLYNRYYMTQFCGKHMMEGEKEAGVLYCDLNGLKYMNDHYGHARGDQMIMEAADQIRQCFPIDMCCRMGGDEFVVCVFGRSEKDFRKQVEELRSKMCLGQLASASIGWCWCEEIEDFDAMMTEAENAMYQEKQKFYEQHPKQKR